MGLRSLLMHVEQICFLHGLLEVISDENNAWP